MWSKLINLLSIFLLYSLIKPSLSAISLTFGKTLLEITQDYIRLRSSSVHRGVFLSLSRIQIHNICLDFYGLQSEVNPVEDTSAEKNKYNLLVQEMTVDREQGLHEWGLVIMCQTLAGVFEKKMPSAKHHYLTSAFRSKWLYHTEIPSTDPSRKDQVLMNFLTLSPDYGALQGAELERWYFNILQRIMALSKESPKYIDQIKRRDDLSILTKMERLILCASILSSHVYHKNNLEISFEWIDTTYRTSGTVNFEEKFVSFKNMGPTEVKMKTECFLCRGFENGKDTNSRSTNLYIARTYEDRQSAMVLKEGIDGTIVPGRYFKNIALLIPKQMKPYYDELIPNIP